MVMRMMDDIKKHIKDITDDDEVRDYLTKIVRKEAFDQKGLIYGMGHALKSSLMKKANTGICSCMRP